MLTLSIGQRYEKLLFWAAPITLATLAVLLIQLGFERSMPLNEAKCIAFGVSQFEKRLPQLERFYERSRNGKNTMYAAMYAGEYKMALITYPKPEGCDEQLKKHLREIEKRSPSQVIGTLREEEKKLRDFPLYVYGMEIPQVSEFDVAGNKLKVPVPTLALVAQIALLPIMLLWLGSLYHTRFREAYLISRAGTIAEVFPHLINLFPVGALSSPKKRDLVSAHQRLVIGLFFASLRYLLLVVFVLPPCAAFWWSLYLSATEENFILPLFAGTIVFIFFLQTSFYEFMNPLFGKIFTEEDRHSGL